MIVRDFSMSPYEKEDYIMICFALLLITAVVMLVVGAIKLLIFGGATFVAILDVAICVWIIMGIMKLFSRNKGPK